MAKPENLRAEGRQGEVGNERLSQPISCRSRVSGYVVYMRLALTGKYDIYTSPKKPCTLEMATSLAEHLRRNRTDAMIVSMPHGEIVAEVRA